MTKRDKKNTYHESHDQSFSPKADVTGINIFDIVPSKTKTACLGYAVLAVEKGQHTALAHAFNWTYNPVDYSSPSGDLLQTQEQVLVFATWAAMPPYYKYCHSMNHALIDCALRKKKLTCDVFHEFGHFQRECPRRNQDSNKLGKKRKVSQGSKKNAVSQPSSTSSEPAPSPSQSHIDKAASKANAAATVRATAEIPTVIDVNAAAEDPVSDAIKAHFAVAARAATVA
ncbi:hypothetical protein HMPREF1544_00693 [Mucor circinelloides 1006PhL]|uniref:Uncharacterized protein n=1 Tax=Mucor circinelloides f. circinelloides (strain 1006PhL) TaxID=1220926 RepID=S2KJ08_MUCC1|nr:hypothetical protein HMPREF1544_00693 [Mucor circinelloides 1006PhL]